MKKNMGKMDRLIRPAMAVLLVLAGLGSGTWLSYIFFVLAGIMIVTSFVGFCPLYVPLGINTMGMHKKKEKKKNRKKN